MLVLAPPSSDGTSGEGGWGGEGPASRAFAASTCAGSISKPTNEHPRRRAAIPVVPDPAKGSSTTTLRPASPYASMHRAGSPTGKREKCAAPSIFSLPISHTLPTGGEVRNAWSSCFANRYTASCCRCGLRQRPSGIGFFLRHTTSPRSSQPRSESASARRYGRPRRLPYESHGTRGSTHARRRARGLVYAEFSAARPSPSGPSVEYARSSARQFTGVLYASPRLIQATPRGFS